ncbi:MAG: hypothetical protein ACXVRI_12505 [Gaiellaceae bacterium]
MAAMKPSDAAELLQKLRERLETRHQDFSDDEQRAMDIAIQQLRHVEGFPDDRSDDR